jgi:hypothetical protein
MNRFTAFVVCLMVCALFGLSFGQENDFRETASIGKRDLPFNLETVKPCLDSVRFATLRVITASYRGLVSVSAADFNGNGRQDIVGAYSTENRVVLFNNEGNGGWSASVLGTVPGASAVFAADLNGDGRVDVVAASETNDQVYWFKNNGDSWTSYPITGAVSNPRSVFVADINGDNKVDIIAAGDDIVYLENQVTNAQPSSWTRIPVTYTGSPIDSVSAADIDKDGFVDIVAVSSAGSLVAWFNNTSGSGSDFVQNTITTSVAPVQVFCTDIDGDGYVDVVTANKDDGSTTLYYNDLGTNNHSVPAGNNNSATAESGWVGVFVDQAQNAPESLFVADVNGDGKQDIVVANTGANNTRWYTTTTNDYTWQGRTVGNVTNPTYVFARDIDGDSAKDIIVASADGRRLAWFEEMCSTTISSGDGVIGGLLILWILIAIAIAVHDYIHHQMQKAAEERKKEAKAMLPTEHDDL